jgi:hypothetical protein
VISEYPPTAAILGIRQRGMRSVGVRVRCPSGAARECRGTLRLRQLIGLFEERRGGGRRFTLAPAHEAEVNVPLWAAARRSLKHRGELDVDVDLVPSAHSLAGSVSRDVVLRLPRRRDRLEPVAAKR